MRARRPWLFRLSGLATFYKTGSCCPLYLLACLFVPLHYVGTHHSTPTFLVAQAEELEREAREARLDAKKQVAEARREAAEALMR